MSRSDHSTQVGQLQGSQIGAGWGWGRSKDAKCPGFAMLFLLKRMLLMASYEHPGYVDVLYSLDSLLFFFGVCSLGVVVFWAPIFFDPHTPFFWPPLFFDPQPVFFDPPPLFFDPPPFFFDPPPFFFLTPHPFPHPFFLTTLPFFLTPHPFFLTLKLFFLTPNLFFSPFLPSFFSWPPTLSPTFFFDLPSFFFWPPTFFFDPRSFFFDPRPFFWTFHHVVSTRTFFSASPVLFDLLPLFQPPLFFDPPPCFLNTRFCLSCKLLCFFLLTLNPVFLTPQLFLSTSDLFFWPPTLCCRAHGTLSTWKMSVLICHQIRV